MWKYLWAEHRSRIYAVAGAVLFLLSGIAMTFLSSERSSGGGDIPVSIMKVPESSRREVVPDSSGVRNEMDGENIPAQAESAPQAEPGGDWCLYITGSVRKPGIYNLPSGSRIFQLIEAAGGFDGFADPAALNLAERLEDGQHIHVPKKSESRSARLHGSELRGKGMMIVVEEKSSPELNFQTSRAPRFSHGMIDINHAPEGDLVRLRGIGPTLARRIIEYRQQHGPFRSVDELILVRGIGAAKINGLRGQATASP